MTSQKEPIPADTGHKKYRVTTDLGSDLIALLLIAFWMFWLQSGWYRVDCGLGIQKACELIAAEEEYAKPINGNGEGN